MAIGTNNTKSKNDLTMSQERWEANLEGWEEVASKITVQTVTVKFTDDETGDTYEATLPAGRVVNVKALSGAGARKSAGFNMNAPLRGSLRGKQVNMNMQSNVFISRSKDVMKARAERAAQKRAAEQQRD